MRSRRIEPEILDELSALDPRAVRSRRDLRRLNALMGHVRIFDEQLGLSRGLLDPRRVLDLGTGDGWLLYELLARLPESSEGREVVMVDRHPSVSERIVGALESSGWRVRIEAADVLDWLRQSRSDFDCCWINLFLHHLRDRQLETLFEGLQARTRSIAACEPRRAWRALWAARRVGWVGCGPVTRADAVTSVGAGFRGGELTQRWPRHADWTVQERAQGLFSHWFHASRLNG